MALGVVVSLVLLAWDLLAAAYVSAVSAAMQAVFYRRQMRRRAADPDMPLTTPAQFGTDLALIVGAVGLSRLSGW